MATYAFKAVDLAGVPARGELEAPDKQAVTDQLRQRGLIVLDINEQKVAVSSQDLFDRFKKVSARDLTVMTRQLATMVASGMSILGAFHVLEEQTENDKLKDILTQVRTDIEAGISLSDALAKHPNVFNRLYVSMARTGEMAGMLEESLMRVAELLEKQDSLRRQVRGAMAYPMMIGIFSLVVLLALVAFLIPVFEDVFKQQNGAKLPFITQISVSASHALTQRWYLIIAGTVGMIFLIKKWKKSEMGTAQWDTIKLKIPAKIGDAIHKIALARWSRTFSGLVHAGVPILQAIEITGKTAGNAVIEQSMEEVITSVKAGGTIAEPLKSAKAFPPMVAQMVGVGEETGAVDSMLAKIADFYDDEVEAAVKALTSIMEPVMIIFVGGIVGVIVVSMYLPLFNVYNQIK